eukprot:988632-Pyramimonas_sp.AAC.1
MDIPVDIIYQTDEVFPPTIARVTKRITTASTVNVALSACVYSVTAYVHIRSKSTHVVVVNKPPSMPVHHAGQYRKNTVVGHLAAFHNVKDVKPVHRLDRPVS